MKESDTDQPFPDEQNLSKNPFLTMAGQIQDSANQDMKKTGNITESDQVETLWDFVDEDSVSEITFRADEALGKLKVI